MNAAEAMAPAGGRGRAERAPDAACSAGDEIAIRVADQGPGIPRSAAPRAVQAVLHHQAGRARPGAGGQPEHRARARRADRRQQPPAAEGTGGVSFEVQLPVVPMSVQVLIADDEALIRQSIRTTLAREGFEVTRRRVGRRGVAPVPGRSARTSCCWIWCWATPTASRSCAGCARRRRTRRSS